MRSFYEMPTTQEPPHAMDASVRLFLQLAVLAFWAPCAGVDLYLIWRGGGAALTFVFWLLFKQALVFLALWFTVALTHGMASGRRGPGEPRRKRPRRDAQKGSTPRDHR